MKRKIVYLIEWRTIRTHWSELGEGIWEVDHNSGIWFTKEGADTAMNERLSAPDIGNIYEMRVTKYTPIKQVKK